MFFAKARPLFKLLSKSYGEELEKLPLFLRTQFLQLSGAWHSPHCCPSILQTPPPDLKLDLTTGSLWVGLDQLKGCPSACASPLDCDMHDIATARLQVPKILVRPDRG